MNTTWPILSISKLYVNRILIYRSIYSTTITHSKYLVLLHWMRPFFIQIILLSLFANWLKTHTVVSPKSLPFWRCFRTLPLLYKLHSFRNNQEGCSISFPFNNYPNLVLPFLVFGCWGKINFWGENCLRNEVVSINFRVNCLRCPRN